MNNPYTRFNEQPNPIGNPSNQTNNPMYPGFSNNDDATVPQATPVHTQSIVQGQPVLNDQAYQPYPQQQGAYPAYQPPAAGYAHPNYPGANVPYNTDAVYVYPPAFEVRRRNRCRNVAIMVVAFFAISAVFTLIRIAMLS